MVYRSSPPARRFGRFRGPTAISIGIHGVALIVLFVLSAGAPAASVGATDLAVLTVAAVDDPMEPDASEPQEAEVEELEFEMLDEPLEEMEVVLESEPTPEPMLEPLVHTPRLEALACDECDVPDLALPTLAAVPPRSEPKPILRPAPPVLRPEVLAAAPPVTRPAPVVRRLVSRARPASGRGRALRAIHKPLHYPANARRLGIQGRARVQMTISAQGTVTGVQLVQSSGSAELDQAALASARLWRFQAPGEMRRIVTWLTFRFA